MVNIRYHHCAYASRASMAQRDNRSDMGCFRVICNVFLVVPSADKISYLDLRDSLQKQVMDKKCGR